MIKTLIFDIDGTLTVSKSSLTPEMGGLLAQLLEVMPLAIMSGGGYAQFQTQFMSGMPANANFSNLYLFPTCAAQCYTYKDGEWALFYSNHFTLEEKARILAALNEALAETGFDKPPEQLWGEQIEVRDDSQISWSALGQQAPIDLKKTWDPDRVKRAPLQAALLKRIPEFSIRVNATTTVDITRDGITKAYGVRRYSEMTGIPIPEMLYVGDALFPGGNDEIVKETGIPTEAVTGPDETAAAIEKVLDKQHTVC